MEYRDHLELERGVIIRGGRLFCWHKWETDVVKGVWRYAECSRCSKRFAQLLNDRLHGPVDWHWLETGEWQPPPTVPPPGGLPSSRRTH